MGTGTTLANRFRAVGIRPCQQCRLLAKLMDDSGPVWCMEHADTLTSLLMARVRADKQWRARVATWLPSGVLRRWITRQLERSIEKTRGE